MKKILSLGLLLAVMTSYAAATVTSVGEIIKVMTYPGVAVLKITTNATGCTFDNKKYVILDTTTTNGRSVYSAALTAFTTGAKTQIAHDGCRSWWGATIPKAYRIDLVK